MGFLSNMVNGAKGLWESTGAKDVWDSKGKYAIGAADLVSDWNPMTAVPKALYHAGRGIYDGVTGDREGAVTHASDALMDGATVMPQFKIVKSLLNLASGTVAAGTDTPMPTVNEAVASGANGVMDDVFGKAEKPKETTTTQKIMGGLGAVGPLGMLGPVGMIAGSLLGNKLGGLFG